MILLLLWATPVPLEQVIPEHEVVVDVFRADKITVHVVPFEWISVRPCLLFFLEFVSVANLIILPTLSRVRKTRIRRINLLKSFCRLRGIISVRVNLDSLFSEGFLQIFLTDLFCYPKHSIVI